MSQTSSLKDGPAFPPLPCRTIVYRAILRSAWIDKRNNKVTSAAFIRRPRTPDSDPDFHGLSVYIAANCSIDEVCASFNRCFGVVSLHVGRIRDIGLDVYQDELKHANITSLPYQEDDPIQVERLAGLLAKQARFVT